MKAVIDWQKAEIVCGRLMAALTKGEYPYTHGQRPQELVPDSIKRDPRMHANFFFYACHFMRGTVKSAFAIQQLIRMWESRPECFDPHSVAMWETTQPAESMFNKLLPYRSKQNAHHWRENSQRLCTHWQGDVRTLFQDVHGPSDLYVRVTNKFGRGPRPKSCPPHEMGFLGFQEKMANMLAYFLMDARLVAEQHFVPPINFHLLRVLLSNEVIILKNGNSGRYEELFPLGSAILERYMQKHGIPMTMMADALWLLSGTLCKKAIGNTSTGRLKGPRVGPVKNPGWVEVDWKKQKHVQRYEKSCGHCPINSSCRFNVSSGVYYETGRLEVRERLKPPLLFDFLPFQQKP